MKVSVLGAGAIGSMLGGLLARDAPDVEPQRLVMGMTATNMAFVEPGT